MRKKDEGRTPIVLTDLEPDELKHVAAYLQGRFERAVELSNGQVVNVSGWLSASLFAINGGGAVALLNISEKISEPMLPAALFGIGLLFALLSGVIIQSVLNRVGAPLEDMMRIVSLAQVRGQIDGDAFDSAVGRFNAVHRWSWLAPISGWISAAFFLAGAITMGMHLPGAKSSHDRTCRKLQQVMLSNSQAAERNRLLFEAIHCRFQD